MKFNKENIFGLFEDHRKGKIDFDNLQKTIMDLDEMKEKIILPKFVAEWLEMKKKNKDSLHVSIDGDWEIMPKAVKEWLAVEFNDEQFARAWLDYEAEKEQFLQIQ